VTFGLRAPVPRIATQPPVPLTRVGVPPATAGAKQVTRANPPPPILRAGPVASGRSPNRCHSIESTSTMSLASGQHVSGISERSFAPRSGWFQRGSGSMVLARTRSRTSHSGGDRQPAAISASALRGNALPAEGPSFNSRSRSSGVARPRCTASHRTARTSPRLPSRRATSTAAWAGSASERPGTPPRMRKPSRGVHPYEPDRPDLVVGRHQDVHQSVAARHIAQAVQLGGG
jgi:hypothetical protein